MNNPHHHSLYISTDKHANPSNRSGRPSKERRIIAFRQRKNQDTQTALDNHFDKFHKYATLSFEEFLNTRIAFDDNFDSMLNFDITAAVSKKSVPSECHPGFEHQLEDERVDDVGQPLLCESTQITTVNTSVSSLNYFGSKGLVSDLKILRNNVSDVIPTIVHSSTRVEHSLWRYQSLYHIIGGMTKLASMFPKLIEQAQPNNNTNNNAICDASQKFKGLKFGKLTPLKTTNHTDLSAYDHTCYSMNGSRTEVNPRDFKPIMVAISIDSLNVPHRTLQFVRGLTIFPIPRHIKESNRSYEDYVLYTISTSRLISIFSNLFVSNVPDVRTILRPDGNEWG